MGVDIGGAATLTSPGTTLAVDGTSRWMDVNASGVITRPQTPYMRGQLQGRGTAYNAGGGPLLVTALENRGSCWNNATGYWTCPVAGYYMVAWGNIAGSKTSSGYPAIGKNGANYHYVHWSHAAAWHYVSISSVVSCAAGDTIHFYIFSYSPADAGLYGEGGHAMYSIALMA